MVEDFSKYLKVRFISTIFYFVFKKKWSYVMFVSRQMNLRHNDLEKLLLDIINLEQSELGRNQMEIILRHPLCQNKVWVG